MTSQLAVNSHDTLPPELHPEKEVN